jgi:hypothetical protein
MKVSFCKVISTVVLGAAYALLLAQAARAQSDDRNFGPRRLEGSWTVEITQRNCQTGEALGNPFLSMLTFSSGGTLVETTANPMFFPAVRGPGHGVWSYAGGITFKAVSVAFITANGVLVKTQTIRQTIELGEDSSSFTTPSASVEFVPVGGGPTMNGCATATGKRIQ